MIQFTDRLYRQCNPANGHGPSKTTHLGHGAKPHGSEAQRPEGHPNGPLAHCQASAVAGQAGAVDQAPVNVAERDLSIVTAYSPHHEKPAVAAQAAPIF